MKKYLVGWFLIGVFCLYTFFRYACPWNRSSSSETKQSILDQSRVGDFNQIKSIATSFLASKKAIYDYCKSFSQRTRLLGPLKRNRTTGVLFFPNPDAALQDAHLLLRYSPRPDHEGGLYLQLATSYLLAENLKQLPDKQRNRTKVDVFLSERFTDDSYGKLEKWFRAIYTPFVQSLNIIRTVKGNQASWEYMMNYTKHNPEIQPETILFLLEDDYIFVADMLVDTIEFFASHDPCFVHPTDYTDRYRMTLNSDDGHLTIVAGKTRHWRSITSTTVTYVCRLKTFLAFEDTIMQPNNDFQASNEIRKRAGNAVFFSAIPSHGAHSETLLLSHQSKDSGNIDVTAYYTDWWLFARRALYKAQQEESFPTMKLSEKDLRI